MNGAPHPNGDQKLAAHASETWNSTPSNSTRSGFRQSLLKRERRGEEVTAGAARWSFVVFLFFGDLLKGTLPLRRMSLSATCNLKDCSIDALLLCTNYAKWPNQLLFPSSAWCACLWMHCPTPLPFFLLLWGTTPSCPFSLSILSLFSLSLFCMETKWSSDFEHSISLCLVRLLWLCTVAQLVFVLKHYER